MAELRMDQTARRLADLHRRIRRLREQALEQLNEARAIEDELADLATLADNWRYVAEKMNGVNVDEKRG